MPILDYPEDRPALGTFGAVDYKPAETEVAPDTATLLGAAFRQGNTIGSMASNKLAGVDLATREDGFTGDVMWEKIKGTPYEKNWDRFANVFNAPGFEAMKAQIDMETEDRRTIDAAGWWGTGASALAGVVDLPTLIPGGAVVREATIGATVIKGALRTAAAGALGAGVSEIALQSTQQTRPIAESAMAVGAGTILGGLLGAGVGAMFSHAERKAAFASVEKALQEHVPTPEEVAAHAEGVGMGAQAVDKPVLGDYGIASGAKSVGALQSGFNPLLRAAHSPSAPSREIMANMAETGFYLEKNVRGEGNLAVESAVKYWDRGALTKALEDMRGTYAKARKEPGFDMTKEEFRTAVSKAMRRGDVGENDAVSAAAQSWRKTLFDPLKDEAIAAGLLPDDVNVKTATSYLTRLWNSNRLNAGEGRFKAIVKPWIDDQLSQLEFKADEIKVGNRIVDAEKQRETFGKVSERLDNIESRLTERQGIRERKVASLGQLQQTRQDVLKERAPADVVRMLRGADENGVMADTVKQARAAERSANRKQTFAERSPILALIKAKGGIRVGSKLDNELRAMGVTPKTHPGMFIKKGGIGDVDNFVHAEDEMFANLPQDGNGYVDPVAVMESIRSELSGNPLRTPEEEATAAAMDNLDKVAAEWLDRVGLAPNASVKDVRDFIGRVTGAEKNTAGIDTRISRFEQEIEAFDQATDAIVNESKITAAEAKTVGEELEKLEAELDAVKDLSNSSPRVALVVDYGTTRRDLFKSKLKERNLSKRVEALKRLDAEGGANDEILAELSAKSIELDRLRASIGGLKAKADKLEPMMPKVKQEIPEFVSPADRADYVGGIVDDIFSQLTGRANQGMPSYDMTMSSRGPLKERTFNIPDHLIEDFLEHDIELIGRRYARVMAADVELTNMDKRLGGAGKPTLASQLDRVKNEYLNLRNAIEDNPAFTDPEAKASALKALAKSEKSDVEDIAGVRDLLRGQYKVDTQHTNYARVLRMAGVFNFMRSLGGVVVSSLSDAARPPMVHGMGRYMSEGIAPLLTNLDAVKLAVEDAKLLGAVTERSLQGRLATMAELADPYASNSPFERFIDNAANVFSKMTLLPWWNDMHKSIASVLVQNRLLKNAAVDYESLAPAELKYMGFLGIDAHMAERISKQFAEFGDVDGNVHIPGIAGWSDEGARRAFAAAVNKDVDSIIVTKSVADVPLFAHTPTGRALLQFKSFALASNQRVLMRGLQEGPGSFITGVVGMSALGAVAYYAKQVESGRPLNDNPGHWIAEGLDKSGIFQLAFEVNNTWEKLGGPGIYNLSAAAFPSKTQQAPASRYANRDAFGALLGPSFQLGTDAAQLLGVPLKALSALTDRDPTTNPDLAPADIDRASKMIPFLTLPYWRWIIEGGGLTEDFKLGDAGLKPMLKQTVAN
ncbi:MULTISPECIES: hypothetical protein [unclassified Mesorhizobium]|uniref:hypothetical protein n=1 Tax=unclassified Mesorhizobium TaxID=325217 RepID=UPI0003D02910|nr:MULTISPECIES: hypothetical protein [unclassified Mesorhizobium]ESZ07181.1 hypothetical protein X736_11055 [Mesorhizobium sp. L2C089B000]WJI52577.1 hypothetical protein NLY44_07885 [Mesorhizobium sp. C089B]